MAKVSFEEVTLDEVISHLESKRDNSAEFAFTKEILKTLADEGTINAGDHFINGEYILYIPEESEDGETEEPEEEEDEEEDDEDRVSRDYRDFL